MGLERSLAQSPPSGVTQASTGPSQWSALQIKPYTGPAMPKYLLTDNSRVFSILSESNP
jgi:hypothetical protein